MTKEHGFEQASPCNTMGILVEGAQNYHHNLAIELCQRYGFDSEVLGSFVLDIIYFQNFLTDIYCKIRVPNERMTFEITKPGS